MNSQVFLVGLLLLGSCIVQGQVGLASSRRIRLAYGDYDCSCSYYCPRIGIQAGRCHDNDYWGWGRQAPVNCCVPSYYDYDSPDMNDYGAVYYRRK